jgi:hypothetical protein
MLHARSLSPIAAHAFRTRGCLALSITVFSVEAVLKAAHTSDDSPWVTNQEQMIVPEMPKSLV